MAAAIQEGLEAMKRDFTRDYNDLLALPDHSEQFLEFVDRLGASQISLAGKTTLIVKAGVLHLQRDREAEQPRYWDNARNTVNQDWRDLHQNLSEDNRISFASPNFDYNAMDKALWELAYAGGRPDSELQTLLMLAKVAFGEGNFAVFGGGSLSKRTVYDDQLAQDGHHSFVFSPEGLLLYDIPLLLGMISVENVQLAIQLTVTTSAPTSDIDCNITPDGNSNILQKMIVVLEAIRQNGPPFITQQCIDGTSITISLTIPKDVVEQGMNAERRSKLQFIVCLRHSQDTRPPGLTDCDILYQCSAEASGVELRIVVGWLNNIEVRNVE